MDTQTMIAAFSAVARRKQRMRALVPYYRSIVVLDITGSARWHNQAQLRAREVLRKAIRAAVHRTGIRRPDFITEDRGDGVLLLISAAVSKVDILDSIVPQLTDEIHTHNATTTEEFRIRLRIAVHAGEVHRDAHGWVGNDLNTAFRLVNADPLRQRLEQAPAVDVVMVVSGVIYEGVVRQRYRYINPLSYTPIHVTVKEVDTTAWLHMGG